MSAKCDKICPTHRVPCQSDHSRSKIHYHTTGRARFPLCYWEFAECDVCKNSGEFIVEVRDGEFVASKHLCADHLVGQIKELVGKDDFEDVTIRKVTAFWCVGGNSKP